MQSTRRENIAVVPGHKVWRQRARLLLTPRAVKAEMVKERRIVLTPFDRMLTAHQADALERWAANEQALSGKASTQSWTISAARFDSTKFSPISDYRIEAVKVHSEVKKHLDDFTREVLSAFTAIQNRDECALSPAQYGMVFCPDTKNKSDAFYRLIVDAAEVLCLSRY